MCLLTISVGDVEFRTDDAANDRARRKQLRIAGGPGRRPDTVGVIGHRRRQLVFRRRLLLLFVGGVVMLCVVGVEFA